MDRESLLDRLEHGIERSLEVPFARVAPFDAMALKRRFLRAADEALPGPVPDRWHLRLPTAMAPHEKDVRALMLALWRSLVSERAGEQAVAARRPSVQIAYDPELAAGAVMVGFEPATPPRVRYVPPPAAAPAPSARQVARGSGFRLHVPPWAIAALVLTLAAAFLLRPGDGVSAAVPPPAPSALPFVTFSTVRYVATTDLNVRREPASSAERVGVIPEGEQFSVFAYSIVEGEEVAGESRWVEVSPLPRYVLGERRYVWYGGLAPR